MNLDHESSDIPALFAVARANWPHDVSAGSEAVWTNWAHKLEAYSFDEVRAALDSLVLLHPKCPSLAEILTAIKERRGAAREAARPLRLAPPPQDTAEARQRVYDQAAESWREEARAELHQFARRYGMDPAELQRRLDAIDEPGANARAGRASVAVHVAHLAASVSPSPPQRPASGALEARAQVIAEQWEADHTSVDPSSMSLELRTAVREILQNRTKLHVM